MDKKVKAGVAAAVLAAGVSVNRAFEVRELTHGPDQIPQIQLEEPVPEPETADAVIAEYTEQRRLGRADRIRAAFLRLPAAVKAAVLLPLWAIGAIPAALATALSPVWRALLGLGLHVLALALVFALAYKLLFPKAKLRELFRKKNLKWFVIAALVLTAVNVLLGEVWAGWPVLRAVLLLAAGYLTLWVLYRRLCGKLRPPKQTGVRTELRAEY